ncbi:gas vesicle protein GvpK [Halomarina litorea]|uniref:gas vesicle protein GvpK n=1 Tax=Halomarina litorea TaxID=2961595 RepID=UPI0020C209BE|nr:gas vesicle protein GvpK [Halomarina sp. BCD28]
MTHIDIDGEDAADGLVALVVAVVELLVEAMEREALRRMESGDLTDEEVERLGQQFAALEAEVERMKDDHDVGDHVAGIRDDLDGLVRDVVSGLETPFGRPPASEAARERPDGEVSRRE